MEQLHIDMRLLLLERCVDTTAGKIYGPQAEYDNTNIQYSNSNIISKISHEQYVQQVLPEILIDTHVNKILKTIQNMVCHEHQAQQVPSDLHSHHYQHMPLVMTTDTTMNDNIKFPADESTPRGPSAPREEGGCADGAAGPLPVPKISEKSAYGEDFHDQVIDTPACDTLLSQATPEDSDSIELNLFTKQIGESATPSISQVGPTSPGHNEMNHELRDEVDAIFNEAERQHENVCTYAAQKGSKAKKKWNNALQQRSECWHQLHVLNIYEAPCSTPSTGGTVPCMQCHTCVFNNSGK